MGRKTEYSLYRVWDGMMQRCHNPKSKNYHNYGGRNIHVCDEWRGSFDTFREYCLSNGWEHGLQIDRIDNSRGYSPDNVRFVTPRGNARNRRTNHYITFNGETLCAIEWCERYGIADSTLWRRITSGWSIKDALTKPIQKRTKRMDGERRKE